MPHPDAPTTDTTVPAAPTWMPPACDPPRSSSPHAATAAAAATAILGGFLVGLVTQLAQGALTGGWSVLANSGVAWSVAAAAIGVLMPTARWAVIGGATSMVVASISYYQAVDWFEGIQSSGRSPAIWAVVGIVAGGAFGLAGWLIRFDADRRWLAVAVIAGLGLGEGRHLVGLVDRLQVAGLVQVAVGITLAIVCIRRDHRPLAVLALVGGGALCYIVAIRAIDAAFLAPI